MKRLTPQSKEATTKSRRAIASADALGATLSFMQKLWALDHALQSASKRMSSNFGVTAPQRLVIRMLGQFPGLTASEVADILRLHRSTVTGILARLETARILSRKVEPLDMRRARLFLTRRGESINRLDSGTVESVVRRVLQRTSPGQIRSFTTVLARLTEGLGKMPHR